MLLWSFVDKQSIVKNLSRQLCTLPAEVEHDFVFSLHTINKDEGLFNAQFFYIFCILLVILLFKMAPSHSTIGLSSIPKHKKTVMCLMEKILVFNKLHSGTCHSVTG